MRPLDDMEIRDALREDIDVAAMIDAYHADGLAKQNIARWYVEKTNWTVTIANRTWTLIVPDTETIEGDLVRNGQFRSQVPGYYNFKTLFEGRLSAPLVDLIKTKYIKLQYNVVKADGTALSTQRLSHTTLYRTYVPDYLAVMDWSLTGADKLWLDAGDTLVFYWSHDSLDVIDFIEDFYFRFAIARIGDAMPDNECCNCS